MTEETAEWLIANDVLVTTSLDGPASLHDRIAHWKGGSAHADVVRWIEYFTRRYAELGRDPAAVARRCADDHDARDAVGVARGRRRVRARAACAPSICGRSSRSRFDADTWATIGYSAEEYLDFYRRALDYIMELNRRGVRAQRAHWRRSS